MTRYLFTRHVYSRWWLCDNLAKRQCTFLHFFTIFWWLESDTVATRLTVNWRTLAYCALVESRAFVKKKFPLIEEEKSSNPIWIICFCFLISSILTRNFGSSFSEIKLKAQSVTNWSRVTDWCIYLTHSKSPVDFGFISCIREESKEREREREREREVWQSTV